MFYISEYYLNNQVNSYVSMVDSLNAAKKVATKNQYYDNSSIINIKSESGELVAQKVCGKW
jgi:hypothetical protein